jgi:hypothetical protein
MTYHAVRHIGIIRYRRSDLPSANRGSIMTLLYAIMTSVIRVNRVSLNHLMTILSHYYNTIIHYYEIHYIIHYDTG